MLFIEIIILVASVLFVLGISLHKFQRIEAKPKLRNVLLVTFCILSIWQFCSAIVTIHDITVENERIEQARKQQATEVARYKGIYTALEDGSIRHGMTYEEVKAICGPAQSTSRSNGVVEYAYYGNVQLCFQNNGRFTNWND